jgi:hypothetical protein
VSLVLAAALLSVFATPGLAQKPPRLKIEDVQVGFGSSPPVAEFKSGFWTPVYVYLKAGPDGTDAGGRLTVETADSDEVRGRYTVAFPKLDPEEIFMVQTYTKPGRTECNITAEINGKIMATDQRDVHSVEMGDLLFVVLGSPLPSLKPALNPKQKGNSEDEDDSSYVHQGRCRVTAMGDVSKLPKLWFAYEPADLVILTTGKRDSFLTALLNEREGRKEALVEWVRRGGNLVVSVARNHDVLRDREFEVLANMLPVAVTGTVPVPHLREVEMHAGLATEKDRSFPRPRDGKFEVAKLEPKPGRSTETLLYWNKDQKETPLVVRGAFGLGSVTVVALDLDEPPFKGWRGQQGVLDWLVKTTTPAFSDAVGENAPNRRYDSQQITDIGGELENALEQFDEIPVISFGWVALFILIYILVVGPLDYFFLKKVVKRLELTWITFPTVVITISVAAYFTAYWLKGNDQKINKVDLVDIDLETQQIYGNSWFTIFSPRIQHYTIGLEPAETDWAPAPASGKSWPVLVSWMGRQDAGWGGPNRGQSQGLFRRAYDYADNAVGMSGVPIQVWSTKTFASSWQASFDPARPLVSADLRLRDKNKPYSGTITSRLPVPLEEVYIYWAEGSSGNWYSLGELVPNTPKRVDGAFVAPVNMTSWLQLPPSKQSPGTGKSVSAPASSIMRHVMFYGRPTSSSQRNLSLRELDQSWRLPHADEVFVVGRIPRREGPAEDISQSKESPSRIWLGQLPATGSARPPLNGTLSQDTYVRMIIPVKTK